MDEQVLQSLRKVPYGFSNFAEVIRDRYYIDKTPAIKNVFSDDSSKAMLITRPRRFGKTLLMDTFYDFLRINPENLDDTSYQEKLFKDTKIYEDKSFCQEFMGKWPVIFVSFKDVGGLNFETSIGDLALAIAEAAGKHRYLLKSSKLNKNDIETYQIILDDSLLTEDLGLGELVFSLKSLSYLLYKHYGKKAIVLIDEYDYPLDKASTNGYYKEMANLMTTLLSAVLKDNNALKKGVLIGSLCFSNESIFSGLNNLDFNTVINDEGFLAEYFGFTQDEVKTMLDYYGLSEHENAVKEWYGGYRVGNKEIFSPWGVINFCNAAMKARRCGHGVPEPKSLWISSRFNNLIQAFMSSLKKEDAVNMQTLLDGGEIEFSVNERVSYNDIGNLHHVDDFWSYLLYTGFLTCLKTTKITGRGKVCTVRIPNREIRVAFKKGIRSYYQSPAATKVSSELITALFAGDTNKIRALIESKLRTFVSIKDLSTKSAPENFYHGFLNGIFSTQTSEFTDFSSNCDAGDGYADIMFNALDYNCGVVIELKSSKNKEHFVELATDALKQIEKMNHTDRLVKLGVHKIYCYGISFYKKICFVSCELKEL